MSNQPSDDAAVAVQVADETATINDHKLSVDDPLLVECDPRPEMEAALVRAWLEMNSDTRRTIKEELTRVELHGSDEQHEL